MKKILNQNKKVAVISGGSGYLGKAIVQKLKETDFEVADISRSAGTDITDSQAVRRSAEKIKKKYGKVSVLIHAASAPLIRKPVLDLSKEDFDSQISVHLTGAFYFFKYFSPLLVSGGVIIGITSKAIELESPHQPLGSYLPAKYALKGLLRVISHELKNRLIRVYEVAPGFMPGGLNKDLPTLVQEFIKHQNKKVADPEEIAEEIIKLINAF